MLESSRHFGRRYFAEWGPDAHAQLPEIEQYTLAEAQVPALQIFCAAMPGIRISMAAMRPVGVGSAEVAIWKCLGDSLVG